MSKKELTVIGQVDEKTKLVTLLNEDSERGFRVNRTDAKELIIPTGLFKCSKGLAKTLKTIKGIYDVDKKGNKIKPKRPKKAVVEKPKKDPGKKKGGK